MSEPEYVVGQSYIWDGTNWVSIHLNTQVVHTPAPIVAAPVRAPAAPSRAAVASFPTRSAQTVIQPTWLLGVFR